MRLHLCCAPDGTPRASILAPADQPEREGALRLLPHALHGDEQIVCDKGYAGREFAAEVEARFAAEVLRPARRDEPDGTAPPGDDPPTDRVGLLDPEGPARPGAPPRPHLTGLRGALLRPGDWFNNVGFAFYGALIAGALAVGVYLWRAKLSIRYLDAIAAGFPLGMAVGRIGDVINGEHYGPPTTDPWGFRYTDPAAATPSTHLAYQSGAFYEVLWALLMFAVLWPLRTACARQGRCCG